MASRPASFSQLWQMPLLCGSLGLFGYATYLLWDPKAEPAVEKRLDDAKVLLVAERPEAAVERLNAVVRLDDLTPLQKSRTHVLLAEGIEQYQDQKKVLIPALQMRIIEQTQMALATGQPIDGPAYRRMARAFESLGQTANALDNYKRAETLDAAHSLRLQRKIIDLELAAGNPSAADAELKEYLKSPSLSDAERCWALSERARVLVDGKQFAEARALLDDAAKLSANTFQEGEINYARGYVSYNLGEFEDAERSLRISRDQFRGRHPLDADACLYLGKIHYDRNQAELAESFYSTVIKDYPETKCLPLAKLGLALCHAARREDDVAVTELAALARDVDELPKLASARGDVIAGLRQAGGWMASRGNAKGTLDLLAAEQTLFPEPAPEFYNRMADAFEIRSNQIEAGLADAAPAEKIKRQQQVREMRHRAADAAILFSQKQTVADDRAYGDSLWRGIGLYEKAGDLPSAIAALELFATERPADSLAPEAILRLGHAYRSLGQFDKAIAAYQRNQSKYPKSLAASKSAVPLAQAYIAKGPDYFGKAQTALESVIDNNPMLDPASEDFRQALFELGQLAYRSARYEPAILRLDEFTKRYPTDDRVGQTTFLAGDCYRQLAQEIGTKQTTAGPTTDPVEMASSRRDKLGRAKDLYDKVVDRYRDTPPTTDTEKLYEKLAHFYRADCLYDLAEYEKAIRLYDNAAFRYQDDPAAVAAYVQLVNAWRRLGNADQVKAATERAKWVIRRIPSEAFKDGSIPMAKEYWADWFKFASESGLL